MNAAGDALGFGVGKVAVFAVAKVGIKAGGRAAVKVAGWQLAKRAMKHYAKKYLTTKTKKKPRETEIDLALSNVLSSLTTYSEENISAMSLEDKKREVVRSLCEVVVDMDSSELENLDVFMGSDHHRRRYH